MRGHDGFGRARAEEQRARCALRATFASEKNGPGVCATAGNFGGHGALTYPHQKGTNMDKDRVKGAAKQAKGAVKEAAGKVLGDAKLQADGKADKVKGKIQNAVGGAKDAVRKIVKR